MSRLAAAASDIASAKQLSKEVIQCLE
jgi:hypothetical protein